MKKLSQRITKLCKKQELKKSDFLALALIFKKTLQRRNN